MQAGDFILAVKEEILVLLKGVKMMRGGCLELYGGEELAVVLWVTGWKGNVNTTA